MLLDYRYHYVYRQFGPKSAEIVTDGAFCFYKLQIITAREDRTIGLNDKINLSQSIENN
jgi:hypothetical protein